MSAHTAPHYYNEIDPFAAQWLRNLIAAGHLPAGDVDERSIVDVKPSDLKGYTQCHFFAGIGGWPLALKLAGWSDDRPVWTGSCPCQPLSAAGQRKGHADERHLWPAFHSLITECRPPTVFGEQVASSDGREWFAGIRADLEDVGYACGGADLCAAGLGAPHIRQRIYWVADATSEGGRGRDALAERRSPQPGRPGSYFLPEPWPDHAGSSSALAVTEICEASYGLPGRVGRLRAYGNAIVPALGAAFIDAFLATQKEERTEARPEITALASTCQD